MSERHEIKDAAAIVDYALAGRAMVTLESERTGARHTYKVTKREGRGGNDVWFVGLLTGPDNTHDYSFLGTIFGGDGDGEFRHGTKSKISRGAPGAIGWAWFWARARVGAPTPGLRVYHEGACGRCGRRLTVPESIETGLGPICAAAA